MRISGVSQQMLRLSRRIARREDGTVLIYVSIALTVFMGFTALVIDGGRLFTLDTEMQSAADALALAGAAELDGNDDAITRATAAMDSLVQNNQTFGNGAAAITGYTAAFLTELPADSQPLSDVEAFATTDEASARFVEVKLTDANDRAIDTMFAPAIGGNSTADASAVAIAGFTSAVCKFTPLFMCNPYEAAGFDTLPEFTAKVDSAAERRKIIALKKPASGGKYTPGNFGFLESGADNTTFKQSLGKMNPGACFAQNGVETKTGNVASAHVPLNTRFDLYANGGGSNGFTKGNADYPTAQNVTKGYLPDVKVKNGKTTIDYCDPSLDATQNTAFGFPIDSSIGSNRMGNGDWGNNFDKYWSINHPGVNKPNGWSSTNLPSRYDVYRWEIDNAHIPNNSGNTPVGENGDMTLLSPKRCSTNPPSTDPDRRVIYAAVINCTAEDFSGHKSGIPVVAFLKMFMTQPMTKIAGQSDEDDTLFVEMIDVVKPGIDDAVIHDIVQLYR